MHRRCSGNASAEGSGPHFLQQRGHMLFHEVGAESLLRNRTHLLVPAGPSVPPAVQWAVEQARTPGTGRGWGRDVPAPQSARLILGERGEHWDLPIPHPVLGSYRATDIVRGGAALDAAHGLDVRHGWEDRCRGVLGTWPTRAAGDPRGHPHTCSL